MRIACPRMESDFNSGTSLFFTGWNPSKLGTYPVSKRRDRRECGFMSELSGERTLGVIAAEINMIKIQTGKAIFTGIIEIGKRLAEAKALVPYGEWSEWLEKSVNYSHKTAANYMRIAEVYGSYLSAAPDPGGRKPELPNLNYTQALILLGVPEGERAQFIAEMDIENMSTRELQKAVKELKRIKQEKEEVEKKNAELEQALNNEKEEIRKLKKERDDLKGKTNGLEKIKQALEQDIAKKDNQITKLQGSQLYKSFQQMSEQVKQAQIKLSGTKVAFLYEELNKAFKELTYELDLLSRVDKEAYAEYKKKLKSFLLKALEF